MMGLLDALDATHRADVVHRGVTPERVRVLPEGRPRRVVLDGFALARLRGKTVEPAPRGAFFGPPEYAAPEQCAGEPVDARADICAAGVVLFELLAGRPPFAGATPPELLARHMAEPPPTLASARPGRELGRALERVVATALAKRASNRFPSARAFAEALEPALA